MISFPAPPLCQYADHELLVTFGETIYPGFVEQPRNENLLRLWIKGEPTDAGAANLAAAQFQTLLGVLRAWRPGAGELQDERRAGLGLGSVRDAAGNQWVTVGTAVAYTRVIGELETFAAHTKAALERSQELRNALWLMGRSNRTAADYYMIHEYARAEFGSPKGLRDALGISVNDQQRLRASANNLSPLEGGRHAGTKGSAAWDLERQREFTSDLLKRWIRHLARQPS